MKNTFCTLWREKGVFYPQFTGAYAFIMEAEYRRRMMKTVKRFHADFPVRNDELMVAAFGDCPCGLQLQIIGEMGYSYIGHTGASKDNGRSRDDFHRSICPVSAFIFQIKNKIYGTSARYSRKAFKLQHLQKRETRLP